MSPKTFEVGEPTYYKRVLQVKLEEMGVKQLVIKNGFFAECESTMCFVLTSPKPPWPETDSLWLALRQM